MINDMKCNDVPDEIGMMVASLGYGQLIAAQATTALPRDPARDTVEAWKRKRTLLYWKFNWKTHNGKYHNGK